MSQIFSDASMPDPKLSLPNQWNAEVVTANPSKPEVNLPSVPVETVFAKHVRQIKEETFWEHVRRIQSMPLPNGFFSSIVISPPVRLGLQIESEPDAAEDIVLAVLGVKST